MTEEPFDALVSVARSWSRAPEPRITGTEFESRGFDLSERAYMLSRVRSEASGRGLRMELVADSSVLCVMLRW